MTKTGKNILVLASLLLLAGCATGPKIGLSPDVVASLRIVTVNVSVAPGAKIDWGSEAYTYVQKVKGLKSPQKTGGRDAGNDFGEKDAKFRKALNADDTRRHLRTKTVSVLRPAVRRAVTNWPKGNRKATMKVVVTGVRIASPFNQIVGGSTLSSIVGKVSLFDNATGKKLVGPSELAGVTNDGGGILGVALAAASDPRMNRASASFGDNIKKWLKAK